MSVVSFYIMFLSYGNSNKPNETLLHETTSFLILATKKLNNMQMNIICSTTNAMCHWGFNLGRICTRVSLLKSFRHPPSYQISSAIKNIVYYINIFSEYFYVKH